MQQQNIEESCITRLDLSANELIALMAVYLSEWEYRDNLLWSQVYKFFYANILVLFMPYVQDFLNVDLPAIPPYYFYVLGLLMSLVFLYISREYALRLKAAKKTYIAVIEKLHTDYQRTGPSDISDAKIHEKRITDVVPIILFISLFSIGVVLLLSYFIT